MPISTNGKGLLLLSGGIDSPVAGYMMAKRGVKIEALHFESFPYTSERAREKVLELASILGEYAGEIKVHIISLTHVQEELVKACQEDYFTLLLRRYMMTLAERVAKDNGCSALITGESLGQVASQTMQALGVTDAAVNMPVFRPCIGMDKEEIITISRKMGAFETSILPFEDCCTVFTPKHPKTKPELAKVLVEEQKLDFSALCDEAYETRYTVTIEPKY
jgi:thiamine biosynthesis protein ThiI